MPGSDIRLQYRLQPGPKYMLPSTVGFNNHDPTLKRSPAFSLGGRFPAPGELKGCTPSPVMYHCTGLLRNGTIRVKGGALGYRTGTKIPYGPSALSYFPNFKKLSTVRNSPSCSLASRPRDANNSAKMIPGPGNYMVPHSIGKSVPHLKTAPAFSVLGVAANDAASVELEISTTQPLLYVQPVLLLIRLATNFNCTSLIEKRLGKTRINTTSAGTPHALSYQSVKCDIYKRKPPEWSILGRFSKNKLITGSTTPAANSYFPNLNYKKNSPSVVFGVKGNAAIPKYMLDDGYDDIKIESHELDPY